MPSLQDKGKEFQLSQIELQKSCGFALTYSVARTTLDLNKLFPEAELWPI